MFHAFDNAGPDRENFPPEWMALLARAPWPLLSEALTAHTNTPPRWLRKPETGLMMVQGRAGGTGERFNLGEITVTRCALRLSGDSIDAAVGVAYVLGRNHRQAQTGRNGRCIAARPLATRLAGSTADRPCAPAPATSASPTPRSRPNHQGGLFDGGPRSGGDDEGDEA
ncbi:hypothetical protein GHT06_006611 [Daphnia sinensis]|uniref:Uncharacterized protein n=1 Tax=Daphnia sinensis TaxID=1820382 RepID=A0AAD5L1E6_9CRUS|nr:hypothetical protein GHT06_006641 [Daphnia sinensis]KAI9549312.1 hypothetical protein GHT06_006611 [Daphnia sinensis]